MSGTTEAEHGEPSQLGEMIQTRVTLKIWDVPPELAQKFIRTAKSSYANKSWLLLQDLMMKADKYDEFVTSGKIQELEDRIVNLESVIGALAEQAEKEPEEEKPVEKAKVPKTFGKVN